MSTWYVDQGLATLIRQWKAEHPGAVVYTIGDASHQSRESQHNPEADNSVDAGDFMPGAGGVTFADLQELAEDLRGGRDKRLFYLIIGDLICSSVIQPWVWRPYSGAYHGHLHVSVNDLFENDGSEWDMGEREYTYRPVTGNLPELRAGDEDGPGRTRYVTRVQAILGVDQDGVYGPVTAAALRRRMAAQTTYPPSSSTGAKLYEPEWRVLYGLWR